MAFAQLLCMDEDWYNSICFQLFKTYILWYLLTKQVHSYCVSQSQSLRTLSRIALFSHNCFFFFSKLRKSKSFQSSECPKCHRGQSRKPKCEKLGQSRAYPEKPMRRDAAAPVAGSCASLSACSSPRSRRTAQPAPWLWRCWTCCVKHWTAAG